jgi:hypothetical protein
MAESSAAENTAAGNAQAVAAYDYSRDLIFINRDDMRLGDIELGISEEKYNSLVTNELLSETINDTYEPEYLAKEQVFSGGLEAVFADFHDTWGYILFSLETTSPEYETARGLKVGDDIGKMHELYGNEGMRVDDTFYYYTKTGDYFQFAITVQNNKVSMIGMSLLTGGLVCGCDDGWVNPAYFMFHNIRHDG